MSDRRIYSTICPRIKEIIDTECDGVQMNFIKRTGFAQSTVWAWCSGVREPNVFALVCICEEFNVSADWLLGLSDKKYRDNTEEK